MIYKSSTYVLYSYLAAPNRNPNRIAKLHIKKIQTGSITFPKKTAHSKNCLVYNRFDIHLCIGTYVLTYNHRFFCKKKHKKIGK